MNTNKTILAGAILGVLVLSACATETTTPTTQPVSNQPAATNNLNVQPTQQVAVTQQVPAHSEADIAAYNSALQLKDASFCDKIKEESYMKECKTALADIVALSNAKTKLDESLCEKLSTDDKQKACKITLQAEIQSNSQQTEAKAALNKQYDLSSKITASGIVGDCKKQLQDDNLIAACEATIITNQAMAAKDAAKCDLIKNADNLNGCKKAVQLASQQP